MNSASKKERCSGVIKQATPILKQLYQSKNDYVKVRALVVRNQGQRGGGKGHVKVRLTSARSWVVAQGNGISGSKGHVALRVR